MVELDTAEPADVEMGALVTETGRVVKRLVLLVDVSLFVESNTGAVSEVGLGVIMVVVEAEGSLRVWMKTGARVELAGEVGEGNLDVTSGSVVGVCCGEDTATVAEAAAGAVAGTVVGDC